MADPLEQIERAQAITQGGGIELVEQRAVRVLDKLVSAYRNGKLDDRAAAVGVATIAELRSVVDDMKRAVLQGTNAASNLTRNT